MKKINKKKLITIASCVLLSFPVVTIPLSTAIVYESIFSSRFETEPGLKLEVNEFKGLVVEQVLFESSVTLTGYKYSRKTESPKGVIVISHGLGGGGHNKFMPYIDAFTKEGYYVFAYDAQGNDKSEGRDVGGFPQGVVDLDNALSYVKGVSEYAGIPLMLLGHSWGAYSVGNVLNLHEGISAAVMVSGFDESEDLLSHYPRQVIGPVTNVLLPYVSLYEKLKFGSEYTDITAVEGISNSQAKILVVHSKDDATVPYECGYKKYFEKFSQSDRVEFLLYENQGHSHLLYSQAAIDYQSKLQEDYEIYLRVKDKKDTPKVKEAFLQERCNSVQYYEPNPELLERIIELYNSVSR